MRYTYSGLAYVKGDRVRAIGGTREGTVVGPASEADLTILGGNTPHGQKMGSPAGWYWVEFDGDGFTGLQNTAWLRPADAPEPKRDECGWEVLPLHLRLWRWACWRRIGRCGFQRRIWYLIWFRIRFGPDPEY